VKLKYIIAVLALLLLMVGTASAAITTYTLTEDNTNVNRDNPGTLPSGIIKVVVTYDDVAGTITYLDQSPHDSAGETRPYLGDPKIDEVAYNLDIDAASILAYDDGSQLVLAWVLDNNNQVDGFGTFARDYTTSLANYQRPDKVVVTLASPDGPIPLNEFNKSVALHLAFEGAYYPNGTAIDEIDEDGVNVGLLGSTYLADGTQIPEFATIATPIAAIIGLLFVFSSRKKE